MTLRHAVWAAVITAAVLCAAAAGIPAQNEALRRGAFPNHQAQTLSRSSRKLRFVGDPTKRPNCPRCFVPAGKDAGNYKANGKVFNCHLGDSDGIIGNEGDEGNLGNEGNEGRRLRFTLEDEGRACLTEMSMYDLTYCFQYNTGELLVEGPSVVVDDE